MKVLITYLSSSGNTKKVAEAIYDSIDVDKEIKALDDIESVFGYDLIYIGFPIIRFNPPKKVKTFIENNCNNRNLALFVTHATWDCPEFTTSLNECFEKIKAIAQNANLIGFFDCQGELSELAADAFKYSSIYEVTVFGRLRPMTIGHPNDEEFDKARSFSSKALARMIKINREKNSIVEEKTLLRYC